MRIVKSLILSVGLAASLFGSVSFADIFEFRSLGTTGVLDGTVLATLDVSPLPANLGDIASFDFTTDGAALFGLAFPASASFDFLVGQIVSDGIGGLKGSLAGDAFLFDITPTPPLIIFAADFHDAQVDTLAGVYFDGRGVIDVRAGGNWTTAIPEPSSFLILTALGLLTVGIRRNRRRGTALASI
jgi:hypothetical protein